MSLKRPFEEELDDSGPNVYSYDDTSSDDSVELESTPRDIQPATNATEKYGIGASLMAKMGYTDGEGLGLDGKGIVEPIEVEKRQKRAGLGTQEPPPPSPPSRKSESSVIDIVATSNAKFARLQRAKQELNLVREQAAVLENAIQIVERDGESLDLTKFYESFGKSAVWGEERLYEVLYVVLRSLIPDTNAYAWLWNHPDVLEAANRVLPENEWGQLLAEKWLNDNGATNLPELLNQWILGQSEGFGAAGLFLSQKFGQECVARRSVAEGSRFVSKLMNTLPDPSYFYNEIVRSILTYAFEEQMAILLTISIESKTIGQVIMSRNNFTERASILSQLSATLSRDSLSLVLEKTDMREQWLNELYQLVHNSSDENFADVKAWWIERRPFFDMFSEESVEPWLEAGLSVINAALDGVSLSNLPRIAEPSPRQLNSTLKDVLSHMCFMNEFDMAATSTGFRVSRSDRNLDLIVDNDILLIRQPNTGTIIPVSLEMVREYLSKS